MKRLNIGCSVELYNELKVFGRKHGLSIPGMITNALRIYLPMKTNFMAGNSIWMETRNNKRIHKVIIP